MADKYETKRVEVGFSGGGSIVLRLSERTFDDLRKAARDGKGWQELDTADGPVALNAAQVVFIKRDPEEHRIGFSGA
jgi:hypothetical protein